MSVLAFDTHEAVLALKQAGFEESQAEAVVTTMGAALGGQVATKADLAEVRTAMETLRANIAEQFATLYKQLWLMAVGIVTLTVTLTVTLVKLLL